MFLTDFLIMSHFIDRELKGESQEQQTQVLSTSRPFTFNPARDVNVLLPAEARLSVARARISTASLVSNSADLGNSV